MINTLPTFCTIIQSNIQNIIGMMKESILLLTLVTIPLLSLFIILCDTRFEKIMSSNITNNSVTALSRKSREIEKCVHFHYT